MTDPRVRRGRRTQVVVALWLRLHGHPDADSPPASMPGRDILNVPGHAPEVKARDDFDPLKWWRQAKKNSKPGEIPSVIVRMRGQGDEPDDVSNYLVFRRLEDDELNKLRDVPCV